MELSRHHKLLIGLAAVIGVLIVRLFYVQIINDEYARDADNNSLVYSNIYPPRGLIFDRNGQILCGNRTSYDILVRPRDVPPFDTLALAEVLDVPVEFIRGKMAGYRMFRTKIGFQTLTFLKQIPVETYCRFAEEEYRFPGFRGQVRTIRQYPFNAGGNLLGYISEVDADYIRKNPEYKSGDYAGRTGIEAVMENELKGEKGYNILTKDSRNRIQKSYKDGEFDKDAIPGKDIVTTIDAVLQQYGQILMDGKVGSLVAIEPSSGEILTMVSSPGIDVDILADFSNHYREVSRNRYKPMFNRTVQGFYPPGSVFKLVNGLIGLEEGVLRPEMKYPCERGFSYTPTKKLGCHVHRSPLDMDEAIMMSCNGYFCYVFRNILGNPEYGSTKEAFDKWREYVCSFGFGAPLGSDFPSEAGGSIPTSARYDKIYGKGSWKFQTIISLSIGQGEVTVTPLQIANLAATVANRGYYYIPHIIKDSDSLKIDSRFHEKHYTLVDTLQFSKVIPGMWRAVNSPWGAGGTATIAAVEGLDICGKTGTAQNPHGADNSVFICFAPKDNPKIAVAAYVENAGFGATWACPIASLLVEKYLKGDISPDRKALEERIINTKLIQ